MSEGRNDYQSLYNDKPYAVVSEGKEEPLPNFVSEGLDEGLPHGTHRQAQPQPAGTETISKEIRSVSEFTGLTEDQTLRFVGCLLRVGLEIFPSAKLAALQRSHDACANALNECEEYFDDRADADHDGTRYIPNGPMKMLEIVRPALANAEKLRAAK